MLPDAPWVRLWTLAGLLVLASLAGLELTARAYGFRPSLIDDVDLWSAQREQVEGSGPRTIALLGASRIVTNVDPDVLRGEFPDHTVVQLGVEGKSPVAALRDLADDPDFNGLVVCCIMPEWIVKDADAQEPYVHRYRNDWGILNRTERTLRTWLQDRFVLPQFRIDTEKARTWLRTGAPPVNRHRRITADRWSALSVPEAPAELKRAVDYRLRRHEQGVVPYATNPFPEDRWIEEVDSLGESVRAIQKRGGQVVFLRNVTSGPILEMDEQAFPRARYWDVLAARTGAATIHFADVPEMARLDCFEGSHLDRDSAVAFTHALAGQLRKLGVVPGLEAPPATPPPTSQGQ